MRKCVRDLSTLAALLPLLSQLAVEGLPGDRVLLQPPLQIEPRDVATLGRPEYTFRVLQNG